MDSEYIIGYLDEPEDERMYPSVGESDIEFEARMERLSAKRNARMSAIEKQEADEFYRSLDFAVAEKKLGSV